MRIAFTPDGWRDFTEWIETDRKKLNRLLRLIKNAGAIPLQASGNLRPCATTGRAGGLAASTKSTASSTASRRADGEQMLEIAQCRHHY